MVLAAADLNKNQLSVTSSAGADMTTLFLAVAFLFLGSLALPMALRHVPAATEHAAAAASQISGPGRMTYMGSRVAGTARMIGGSSGGQAIVRQAGAAAGPVGVAATRIDRTNRAPGKAGSDGRRLDQRPLSASFAGRIALRGTRCPPPAAARFAGRLAGN